MTTFVKKFRSTMNKFCDKSDIRLKSFILREPSHTPLP